MRCDLRTLGECPVALSDALSKAKSINVKYQEDVAAMIYAINKAIVLIGVLALVGISLVVADQKFADDDRANQEITHVYRR